jgi:hypothetical protein
VRAIENTFSWSASRDGSFRRCPREYWWNYYGSWGGWSPDAPPEARAAYVLKNLSTRWAWVGTLVHEAIEGILRRVGRGANLPDGEQLQFESGPIDVEEEVQAMTRRMRSQFVESRGGAYRSFPKKRFGLAEHEYGEAVPDEEWRAMRDKAQAALRSFLTSELFTTIRASDPRVWYPIEELGQFPFEGVPVWAVLDFAMRRPDGGADIYDWKTGAPDAHANRLQLVCYALFMEAEHGVRPSEVRNHLVYLGREVKTLEFTPTPKDLEEARHQIRQSIIGMRSRLLDPAANVADRDAYPMTEDLARCASCTFRRLCGRG